MDDIQPEPQGLPQYMRDRMKPRHTLRKFFIVATIILACGALWGLFRYASLYKEISSDEAVAAMIAQQRGRLTAPPPLGGGGSPLFSVHCLLTHV